MEALQKHLGQIKVPCVNENVYNVECVYSFENPESPTGLYVSLTSFLGFGEEHARAYADKTGNKVFLHLKWDKVEIPNESSQEGPEKKITRLAIGVEGGFPSKQKKYEYKEHCKVVVLLEANVL